MLRGTFSCFWIDVPFNRLRPGLSSDPSKMRSLADELGEMIGAFSAADLGDIQTLFQPACQTSPFWVTRITFD